MKKIIFIEGLPSVGKTYLVNQIRRMNLENVYVVDELINPDIKNPFIDSEDKFLKNDEMKVNKYDDGIIIIDRGPISTLVYNQVLHLINHKYDASYVENWFNQFLNIYKNEVFNGLLLKYYNCVNMSNFDKLKAIMKIDFHDEIDYINNMYLQNELDKMKVVQSWYELLNKMIMESSNVKEQQRIAQYICSELKLKKTIEINGNITELNHITPRLLWENGYNTVIIKSSAYLMGIQSSCEEFVIPKRKNIINSYICNMGVKNMYGLKPMAYFHPHGLKYEFQMNGPNKVILVNGKAKELNERKHYIRANMTRMIQNHFVNWFNGEKVLWDTNLNTNLVHTTDDAVEASIHLLSGYPEYQSFTRFNYPNPVLRKEKRK